MSRIDDILRKRQAEVSGTYPEGKVAADDEGALVMAVTHDEERVLVKFGHPVAWVGCTAEGAEELAKLLFWHARRMRMGK